VTVLPAGAPSIESRRSASIGSSFAPAVNRVVARSRCQPVGQVEWTSTAPNPNWTSWSSPVSVAEKAAELGAVSPKHGPGVGVGVLVPVGGSGVGVWVALGVAVGVLEGVAVRLPFGVGVRVIVGVRVGVCVLVAVIVTCVDVRVGVLVTVGVLESVGVRVMVGVRVIVGVRVTVGVRVGGCCAEAGIAGTSTRASSAIMRARRTESA
jgi:hypothetical protein